MLSLLSPCVHGAKRAPLLGNVGRTTVSGVGAPRSPQFARDSCSHITRSRKALFAHRHPQPSPPAASLAEPSTGQYFAAGEDIYGPFEAGFSSRQDFVLSALGCATGKGYVDGGIDTMTAEALIAEECGGTYRFTPPIHNFNSHLPFTPPRALDSQLSCRATRATGSSRSSTSAAATRAR